MPPRSKPAAKHLWEHEHPYYCAEGNFYSNECEYKCASWAEFVEEWGDCDEDMNFVMRWDWYAAESEWRDECEGDSLQICYVGQRKGKFWTVTIDPIDRADEPAVLAWLTKAASYMRRTWEPLLSSGAKR